MNPLLQLIEEQKKEFDVIAGEDILEHYDEPLPEGHLTRGFDFPESARELDEKKVWNWHTSSIKAILQAQVEMLELEKARSTMKGKCVRMEKYKNCGSCDEMNGRVRALQTQINLLQETIKKMK